MKMPVRREVGEFRTGTPNPTPAGWSERPRFIRLALRMRRAVPGLETLTMLVWGPRGRLAPSEGRQA